MLACLPALVVVHSCWIQRGNDMDNQFFSIPATEILDRLIQSYQDEIVKLRQQNAELESENEELREVINQIGRE